MKFEPNYKNFISRVWLQVNKTLLLLIIVLPVIAVVSNANVLYVLFLGILPVSIILLVRSFFINQYFLKSIEIDEIMTKLIIYRFDKKFKIYNIEIKDLDVKINQIFFSLRPFYKLQLYEKKKMIYQQCQGPQWQIDSLVDLYKEIKRLKGETAHTSWIKL